MTGLSRWRLALSFGGLALLLAACGAPAEDEPAEPADPEPEEDLTDAVTSGLDEVCAQGQEEGSFTTWEVLEPESGERIFERFSSRYPGIEANLLFTRDTEAVQNIIAAVNAGEPVEPDLVGGTLHALDELVQRGLVDDEVDWASLGIDDELITSGNFVRNAAVAIGLGYNTNTTSPDELPDTWEELIDERYRRNVVVDPRKPLNLLALEWGEEQTMDYAQRLKDVVDPIILEGGTAGMAVVLSEEAMTTIGARADGLAEMQADGAPIDIKYLDLVPLDDNYHALTVDSDNVNAAMCYVGWLSTPEGRAVWEEVEYKTNTVPPPGVPQDAITISVDSGEEASLAADMASQITDLLVGR